MDNYQSNMSPLLSEATDEDVRSSSSEDDDKI